LVFKECDVCAAFDFIIQIKVYPKKAQGERGIITNT